MDTAKVQAIVSWEVPTCLREVRSFIGFCNFYRRFIRGFSKIAGSLNALAKKGKLFEWNEVCERAFQGLKQRVIEAPVLAHFDPKKQCYLETDSSDYVNGGIMSQNGEDGELHSVAFFSKNLNPAECNYEIYDKELLAISDISNNGGPNWKAPSYPLKSSPTIKAWNIL